jgi:hypothetical protein
MALAGTLTCLLLLHTQVRKASSRQSSQAEILTYAQTLKHHGYFATHRGARYTHMALYYTNMAYEKSLKHHIFAPPTADGGVYLQKSSFQ